MTYLPLRDRLQNEADTSMKLAFIDADVIAIHLIVDICGKRHRDNAEKDCMSETLHTNTFLQ